MKIYEIETAMNVLQAIAGKKLPIKLSYAASRNADKLQHELEIYNQKRIELCQEYAELDKDGKPVMLRHSINGQEVQGYKIPEEVQPVFADELNELRSTDVSVDIVKVGMDIIERIDDGRYDALTPSELHALAFMIEEE